MGGTDALEYFATAVDEEAAVFKGVPVYLAAEVSGVADVVGAHVGDALVDQVLGGEGVGDDGPGERVALLAGGHGWHGGEWWLWWCWWCWWWLPARTARTGWRRGARVGVVGAPGTEGRRVDAIGGGPG